MKSSVICKYWLMGACRYGYACNYKHPSDDVEDEFERKKDAGVKKGGDVVTFVAAETGGWGSEASEVVENTGQKKQQ